MVFRFRGGVQVAHYKHFTDRKAIEPVPLPRQLIVSIQQHLGAPANVVVNKGDLVKKGQILAEAGGYVSVPVHAPTSGKVVAVEKRPHSILGRGLSVVLDVDGEDDWLPDLLIERDWYDVEPAEIREIVRQCGVVGMGGATFPTHVKLSPPPDKPIDTVLINGAECEPYTTADHVAMREMYEEMIVGIRLIVKAVGAQKAVIGIENNKPDIIKLLKERLASEDGLDVAELPARYPQGAERSLIHAILDRHLPAGKLPLEVGVLVQNSFTAIAVANAIQHNQPLIESIVTVTGSCVQTPKNLRVLLGTRIEDLIEHCGGFSETPGKIVMGGPMMGIAQYTLDSPVVKATNGVICMSVEQARPVPMQACIRCGRCLEACPMGLAPTEITEYALKGDFGAAQDAHALDCVECGCCTFACPAHRPMVQTIRAAKVVIRDRMSKN